MSSFCLLGEDAEIVKSLMYSANGLSMFGTVMVLITYIMIPKLRKNWLMRYIAYLNISNLFLAVMEMLIFYYVSTKVNQETQSFKTTYFVLYCSIYSTFIWPLILAINLYQIIAKRNNNLSRYEPFCLFIGFVAPIIIAFILNCFGLIHFASMRFKIIEFGIPEILIGFFSLLTYIKLITYLAGVFY